MAKIVKKKPGDRYVIKHVPQGYRDLYQNPYRYITIVGKAEADRTVVELTALEIIDKNERKLGKTDIPEVSREISIGELFTFL